LSERTHITSFLLLSVLAGILLVSGSLQCTLDCLVQADSPQPSFAQHSLKNRVDSCHPSISLVAPTVSCLNKACHQRLPHHRNLGGPEIYRLENLAQPLYGNSRQPSPQYRAGSAIELATHSLQSKSRFTPTSSNKSLQTHFSIRTTVILC